MTDKVQKIRERIEIVINRRLNLLNGDYFDLIKEVDGFTNEIMDIIGSLQEEHVSEDLEKAANEWDAKASFTPFYMTLDDNGNPTGVRQHYTTHAESFKASAKWQKQQDEDEIRVIRELLDNFDKTYDEYYDAGFKHGQEVLMKDAVKGLVVCDELTHGYKDIAMHIPNYLNVGDKVKLIIIKEG